jgi:hypothetical protein
MNCKRKHCKYQPEDKDYVCPDCKGHIYIDVSDDLSDDTECELLHDDDYIVCEQKYCEYNILGKSFSQKIKKSKNIKMEKCECCNGKGWIEVKR